MWLTRSRRAEFSIVWLDIKSVLYCGTKSAEVKNQAEADHILAAVRSSEFLVESVVTKEKKRNPVPPFTTSKLQQDAARRLRFTVKKTMMLAQRLYEGIELGDEGRIGLPSTYATILTTIQDREYVTKDQGKFRPTELGTVVTEMLVKHFEDIFDVQYTARMEEELDEVEEGKMTWVEALDEFYTKFKKDLKQASKNMENLKAQEIPTDEKCEKCGSPMVIKWGQFGRFMACSAYPECKNTKEIA